MRTSCITAMTHRIAKPPARTAGIWTVWTRRALAAAALCEQVDIEREAGVGVQRRGGCGQDRIVPGLSAILCAAAGRGHL